LIFDLPASLLATLVVLPAFFVPGCTLSVAPRRCSASIGRLRFRRVAAKEIHMTAMYSLKDVVKQIGVQGYRIQHAYSIGAVEEPRTRVSGRRVFEPVDIRRLAKHFGVTPKDEKTVTAAAAE
jgi:hypothetical protein